MINAPRGPRSALCVVVITISATLIRNGMHSRRDQFTDVTYLCPQESCYLLGWMARRVENDVAM